MNSPTTLRPQSFVNSIPHRGLFAAVPVALTFLAAVFLGSSVNAQDWAKERIEKSPRHLEWVKVKNGDREVNSFIAFPEVKDKATAVIVIHEIFGLTDWVRGVADQLAEAGYIAIAPDLLSGMAPGGGGTAELGGSDGARRVIGTLPPEQITADLEATVAYLKSLPACNGKVAVAGFCWGGSQTFRFATNTKDIVAAFPFYGTGPDKLEDIQRITVPVHGFYGGNDARVNASLPTSEAHAKEAGKTFEPVIYKDAGHGFMRAGEAPDASEANRQGRTDAWKRWKALLEKL